MASPETGLDRSAPLTFSIVIPTHARPGSLRRCLEGLASLDFDPAEVEAIVVDDGGPAPLDPVIAGLPATLEVRLIATPRGGPGSARNAGARLARGRYLAFIDDDCVPDPGWLGAFRKAFAQDDRRLLGGRVENALVDNPYSDASERISGFVYERGRTKGAAELFFTTNNIALRTDLFRSQGGFSTTIPGNTAEDKEFCDRWRAAGLPLAHTPEAIVRHSHNLTLRKFLRQHFNYGRGILAFRLMRRDREHRKLVPEPSTFYFDLVTSPMRAKGSGGHRFRAAALIALAQVATIAGAALQAARWPLDRNGRRVAAADPNAATGLPPGHERQPGQP